MIDKLIKKIKNKNYVIGIIGLGYVGLPLIWTFFKNSIPTIGFDIDENKISKLKAGKSYIKHLGDDITESMAKSNICDFTSNFSRLSEADALLMCVPTPLNKFREPDMSYVISTTETIAKTLRPGQLIVLESTTYPGTTDELIIPILEKKSGLKSGEDFFVAYSPEREDPGNKNFNTALIPKVVGSQGPDGLRLAVAMYQTSIKKVIPVTNTKTAEAVKLTENIFRSVNIALVNELKVIYDLMDIDVHEVLSAAETKPFGFMKFEPGPGLGGHCIPIDPFYLTWKARQYEKNTKFIELAGEINTYMPYFVIEKTIEALNENKKALNGSKILIVGLAYKPDIDDMRESPSLKLFKILKSKGASFEYHDPFIDKIPNSREYKEYMGMKSVKLTKKVILNYDAIIISTNHSNINYDLLRKHSNCIIDTRNVFKNKKNIYQA